MCLARSYVQYKNIQRGQKSDRAHAYLPYFCLKRNAHLRIGVKSLRAGWKGQIGSVWLLWKIKPFFSLFYSCEKLPSILKKVIIRAYAASRKLKIYSSTKMYVCKCIYAFLTAGEDSKVQKSLCYRTYLFKKEQKNSYELMHFYVMKFVLWYVVFNSTMISGHVYCISSKAWVIGDLLIVDRDRDLFFAIEIPICDRHLVKRSQDDRDREFQRSRSQNRDRDLFSSLLAISLWNLSNLCKILEYKLELWIINYFEPNLWLTNWLVLKTPKTLWFEKSKIPY